MTASGKAGKGAPMSHPQRLFTPVEANQTLPLVRQIVADILQTGREVRDLQARHGAAASRHPEFLRKLAAMDELMTELTAIGCSFRDWSFEIGLVDFPAIVDGDEVLLCWRSDEPDVRFYHGVNAGYAGRKPIPEGLLGPAAPAPRRSSS